MVSAVASFRDLCPMEIFEMNTALPQVKLRTILWTSRWKRKMGERGYLSNRGAMLGVGSRTRLHLLSLWELDGKTIPPTPHLPPPIREVEGVGPSSISICRR
jgi:hypothetical protein